MRRKKKLFTKDNVTVSLLLLNITYIIYNSTNKDTEKMSVSYKRKEERKNCKGVVSIKLYILS